jgi:hypothetical protein
MADEKPSPKKKKLNAYLQYSGMALQFFVLIFIAAIIGKKLDEYFETPKPYITVFFILFFSFGYFYKMYHDLTKP